MLLVALRCVAGSPSANHPSSKQSRVVYQSPCRLRYFIAANYPKKCLVQGIEGINSVTVDTGSSTLSCDAVGYNPSDSISYTCLNGEFTYTGSCGSCATGYSRYNGECQPNCETGSVTGIVSRTVNAGFGELNCNVTGYSPADSISYTCIGGVFSITGSTSCNICDDGYNYFNSLCQGPCDISIVGVTKTSVSAGTSTLNCDKPNFTGTINYTCSNTTPRFSSTGSCSCATGYSLVSDACKQKCTCYRDWETDRKSTRLNSSH